MAVISSIAVAPVVKVVNPTATELDRWRGDAIETGRITLENLTSDQTVSGWLETRDVFGSGLFARVGETTWYAVAALAARNNATPSDILGAAEVRFMATASGGGGTVRYTRRFVHTVGT